MKRILMFLASIGLSHSIYAQTTWYVDSAQADNNGAGTSWATAKKELQAGINAAASGDQVWVKAGTYKPTLGTDRNISINLKNGVAVYGGFTGTETQLFQRNDIANVTILSGDLLGNDAGFTNNGDNSYNIVKCYSVNSTILDGFTITKGNSGQYGGALDCNNSSPILNNIVFAYNYASIGGGAVTFYQSSPVFTNCVFDNNVSNGGGGAVDVYLCTSVKFTNCIFYQNKATYSGAFNIDHGAHVNFTNCTLSLNRITGSYASGGYSDLGTLNSSDVAMKNSIIWNADGSGTRIFLVTQQSNFSAYYTIVQNGWASLLSGDLNPWFADPNGGGPGPDSIWRTPDDGLRIPCSSQAIDAGDPSITNTMDIMGMPRTNIPDIGAYESGSQENAALPISNANSQSILAQNATGTTNYATCSGLLTSVNSKAAYTIAGTVLAKVWFEPSQPAEYVKRHYEITPAQNAEAATGFVTLYFTQQEFNDFNAVNGTRLPTGPSDAAGIANLRIEKRPGKSSTGTGLPGSYIGTALTINPVDSNIVWNNTASRWEVNFEVTGFGGFFVKTTLQVLPLRLMSFAGSRQAGYNKLNWQTADEVNTKSFELLRSNDGIAFTVIKTLDAKRNVRNDYQYNDALGGNNVVFYQLHMLDIDGKSSYSNIVKISGDNTFSFSVSPNPLSDVVHINISSPSDQKVQIHLIDALGKTIFIQKNNVMTGANTLTMDMSALSKGIYFLKMEMNGKLLTVKLVKR